MKHLNLYFIFYVVMILELLIFIVDRDEAEDVLVKATRALIKPEVVKVVAPDTPVPWRPSQPGRVILGISAL